jgi:hypothetical protein
MSTDTRCHCQSCTVRGLMGPVVVITVGVLFLLSQMAGGYFHFGHTFPVLLIVIGLVQLGGSMASREGHIDSPPSIAQAPPPPPPASAPQPPFPPQGR